MCRACPLGLLHNRLMRCTGRAPDELTWELGLGPEVRPFLVYEDEYLVGGEGCEELLM